MTISSDISINLDAGFDRVRNCHIHVVTNDRASNDIRPRICCIDSGKAFHTDLLHDVTIGVLEIIAGAKLVPESDFMERFPRVEVIKEEKDALEM